MVEWLKCQDHNQHGLGSKPTRAILLCPWERHFMALSMLDGLGKQIEIKVISPLKFQADSNILAFLEAGQGNCLPYV